jgi:hypothetical protein
MHLVHIEVHIYRHIRRLSTYRTTLYVREFIFNLKVLIIENYKSLCAHDNIHSHVPTVNMLFSTITHSLGGDWWCD